MQKKSPWLIHIIGMTTKVSWSERSIAAMTLHQTTCQALRWVDWDVVVADEMFRDHQTKAHSVQVLWDKPPTGVILLKNAWSLIRELVTISGNVGLSSPSASSFYKLLRVLYAHTCESLIFTLARRCINKHRRRFTIPLKGFHHQGVLDRCCSSRQSRVIHPYLLRS